MSDLETIRSKFDSLRPELLPVSRRPTGPSAYDHALRASGLTLRFVYGRIVGLDTLLGRREPLRDEPAAAALIDVVTMELIAARTTFDRLQVSRHDVAAEPP